MKRTLCAALAAGLLLLALPAMLFAGPGAEKAKKITIGMPLYNQQHEFWQNIYNTAKSYAAEKGIELVFLLDVVDSVDVFLVRKAFFAILDLRAHDL